MAHALGGGYGYFAVRMGTWGALAFGALGLVLAVVGLYGVVSYAVSRRKHEIGIRMALGATPGAVLRMILRESLLLVGLGLVAGLAVALVFSEFLRNFLYGVSPRDPLT